MTPTESPEPRQNNSRVLLWVALVLVLLGINGVPVLPQSTKRGRK